MQPKSTITLLCLVFLGALMILPGAAAPGRLKVRSKKAVLRKPPTAMAVFHKPLPRPPRPRWVKVKHLRLPDLNDLVVYFRGRGIRACRAGRYREAAVHLRKALDLKPDDRLAQAWMVRVQGISRQ